eukprot:1150001-Pelagomonas_calceolata.AAC.3
MGGRECCSKERVLRLHTKVGLLQRQHKSVDGRSPMDEPGPPTAPECFMPRHMERHCFTALPASSLSEPLFLLPQLKAESSASELQKRPPGRSQIEGVIDKMKEKTVCA